MYISMNNPYILCAISGLCIYIFNTILQKSQNKEVEKMENIKLSVIVMIGVFALLHFYEKESLPILSEPFISSQD